MAAADLRQELDCPICLDIFTDPIMLRCGHNFCRACITKVLNTQKLFGVYSCPECREKFKERPGLQRNIMVRKMVESLLSPNLEKIFCTYCVDGPCVPAVKTCLLCEASLCDKHLRVHSKSPEHVLTDPSTSLEKRKCPIHKKVLEYYCTEDGVCICMSCTIAGEHQGHRVESLQDACQKKKKELGVLQQQLIKEEEKIEKRLHSLQERGKNYQGKANDERKKVTNPIRDIRRQLDTLEERALNEISRQEKGATFSDPIQKLQMKKNEVSKKKDRIGELHNVTDPLTILQESAIGDFIDSLGDDEDSDREVYGANDLDMSMITKSVNELSDAIVVINKGIYLKAAAILLDVNTAGNNLSISDDGKTATVTRFQNRAATKDRFYNPQVISTKGFSGKLVWEVEISKSEDWRIGMCYPSIDRKGQSSGLGYDHKSWCLRRRFDTYYTIRHNNQMTNLPHIVSSDRVRVCLDYQAGELSFYELGTLTKHLHTFHATFTEPLHAAMCVWNGILKICD